MPKPTPLLPANRTNEKPLEKKDLDQLHQSLSVVDAPGFGNIYRGISDAEVIREKIQVMSTGIRSDLLDRLRIEAAFLEEGLQLPPEWDLHEDWTETDMDHIHDEAAVETIKNHNLLRAKNEEMVNRFLAGIEHWESPHPDDWESNRFVYQGMVKSTVFGDTGTSWHERILRRYPDTTSALTMAHVQHIRELLYYNLLTGQEINDDEILWREERAIPRPAHFSSVKERFTLSEIYQTSCFWDWVLHPGSYQNISEVDLMRSTIQIERYQEELLHRIFMGAYYLRNAIENRENWDWSYEEDEIDEEELENEFDFNVNSYSDLEQKVFLDLPSGHEVYQFLADIEEEEIRRVLDSLTIAHMKGVGNIVHNVEDVVIFGLLHIAWEKENRSPHEVIALWKSRDIFPKKKWLHKIQEQNLLTLQRYFQKRSDADKAKRRIGFDTGVDWSDYIP